MSSGRELPADARTLFSVLEPAGLPHRLKIAEQELVHELRAGPEFIPTGIRDVDYLVDQLRFFRAGREQAARYGLVGVAALEWVEYLSWPECWLRARTGWRRQLLRRCAFEEPVCLWQRALQARRLGDATGVGPPRAVAWFPPSLQFGPYPMGARSQPTPLSPVCLEAHVKFDPWTKPGPLIPVRRLNQVLTWTLQISAFRLYAKSLGGTIDILIDEPRGYSPAEERAVLMGSAKQAEEFLRNVAGHPSSEFPGWAAKGMHQQINVFRAVAAKLDRASTRQRAEILEQFFATPGAWRLGPVEVLPEDLPPEWLGILLGFAFERKGLLSVRERKRLRESAVDVLERWQRSRFPGHELSQGQSGRVIDRVARFRRPLRSASFFKYLAKAVYGAEQDARRAEQRP